ncbi:MAG TPA: hypothetical protein VGG60_01770 [Candidatus Binataceae bacterium]|jgi:hypothetical protein
MNLKSKSTLTGAMVVMTLGIFAIPFGAPASADMVLAPSQSIQYAQDDHTQVKMHSESNVTNTTTGVTDTPQAIEKQHVEHETTETDHQSVGIDGTVSKAHSKTKHVVKKEQMNLNGSSLTEKHEQEEQQTTTDKTMQN